jgi:pimeloyl-ACP methyl ester carboxylesterase
MRADLPAAVITARTGDPVPEGTALASAVATEWPLGGVPFVPTETSVVFIHGYNNQHAEVRYKYAVFREFLHELGVVAPVIEFHWPGNLRLGFLSFISYPTEITPAIKSGQLLASWLRSLSRTARLFLVTHSMGGRVAVEALNALRATGDADRVLGICMMAAAVRVDSVASGSQGPAANEPIRWRVLYSGSDNVLHWAFPLGQTAAADGLFPTAVGRYGDPSGKWEGLDASGYDHSYYWFAGKPAKKDSDGATQPLEAPIRDTIPDCTPDGFSSNKVAEFIGVAVGHVSPTMAHTQQHDLAAAQLDSNAIPVHAIGL